MSLHSYASYLYPFIENHQLNSNKDKHTIGVEQILEYCVIQ